MKMKLIDYTAIVLTIIFIFGIIGCISHGWGTTAFFYGGVTIMSGSILAYMGSQ